MKMEAKLHFEVPSFLGMGRFCPPVENEWGNFVCILNNTVDFITFFCLNYLIIFQSFRS